MYYTESELIIRDNFDLNDRPTLKAVAHLNEASENQVLESLCKKLYENVVNKVDDINFAEIDLSEGDITRIPNYNQLSDAIATMHGILKEFKQDTKPVETIALAMKNIQDREEMFTKGYKLKLELPMITYSVLAASIVTSTSFLIAATIEFIKNPKDDSFNLAIDRVELGRSRDHLLFRNLDRFNASCANGKFDQCMNQLINSKQKNLVGLTGGVLLGTTALIGIISLILPLIRELIYFYFYSRVQISDFFEVQADLLQMNAYNLQNTSDLPKGEREKIVKKQLKVATNFRAIADKVKVECNKAERKADQEITNTNKKYKVQDVMATAPDAGSGTVSSLF